MHIFDINGDNLLINNNILYKLFSLLLSKYINIIFEKNLSILNSIIPNDPFDYHSIVNNNESFYDILYYYNMLNYKILNTKILAFDKFWNDNIHDLFYNYDKIYEFNDNKSQYQFKIWKYLISIFFNDKMSPQILLFIIKEFNDKTNIDLNNSIIQKEMFVLFNFIKIYFPNIVLNKTNESYINFINLNIKLNSFDVNYDDMMSALKIINRNSISNLISILFLRALLPYILYIISEIENVDIDLFYFDKEKFFSSYKSIIKFKLIKKENELLIKDYLRCLNEIINDYSSDLSFFSEEIKIEDNNNDDTISYMNKKIYNQEIEKIKEYNEKSNYKILLNTYYENREQLKINYNWSFHFFEIIFYCFYLNFAHCEILLYENGKKNSNIYKEIRRYLDIYEKNDYYFNFINEEGAKLNITRIIQRNLNKELNQELNKELNSDYFRQKISVRRKLLKEHKYNLISEKKERQINIFKMQNNYGLEKENNQYNEIILDISNDLGLFQNSYYDLNDNLKRFFFDGYNENKNSTIDEFCNDLNKIYEQIDINIKKS